MADVLVAADGATALTDMDGRYTLPFDDDIPRQVDAFTPDRPSVMDTQPPHVGRIDENSAVPVPMARPLRLVLDRGSPPTRSPEEAAMKPWITERIEQQRAEREWQPQPLRIQPPPPEWVEEQERRSREEADEAESGRGVWTFQM
jgi:Mg-chelatase subunit ChlI